MLEPVLVVALGEIVARLGGEAVGEVAAPLTGVASLDSAGPAHISFLANPRYRAQLASTRAGAVILGKTVTTEFATFTPAITVNPRDFAHTPGGSSVVELSSPVLVLGSIDMVVPSELEEPELDVPLELSSTTVVAPPELDVPSTPVVVTMLVEDAAVAGRCEQRLAELIAGSVRVDADDPTWRERARRRSWMRKWPGVLAG